ncbi:hypothetical protein EDD29_0651 [Actinocorallia herbida]|uniref:AlpA family transcriptional regulator n=1 Tax=Actinocorallia herbida TaxID=58109 RepID=A0A3N1CPA7_9ACTN|nr:hypothetical protein [Actinocorallia herbida]ROO83157.1 hypothetical protein EDD29_0651 [Actinocorallia herbida]
MSVKVYGFVVRVEGFSDDAMDGISDRLYGLMAVQGGVDAVLSGGENGGTIFFDREAEDAVVAVVSAIEQVEAAGLRVLGVSEDNVTAEDIAEQAGVTLGAVSHWVSGVRGGGGFPAPVIERQRGSLWSWAEVSQWLSTRNLGKVDEAAVEVAHVAKFLNALITAHHERDQAVPAHRRADVRPFVDRLIA